MEPGAPPIVHETAWLVSGLVLMVAAAVAVWFWQRGRPPLVWAFALGALVWASAFGLRVSVQIAFGLPATSSAGVGVLAAVFDCAAAWLVVSRTRLKKADWDGAVAFGLGFGAVEAFLAGTGTAIAMLVLARSRSRLSEDAVSAISNGFGSSFLGIPVIILDRFAGLAVCVAVAVLVIYAVRMRDWRWLAAAFAYKATLGVVAALDGATLDALAWVGFAVLGVFLARAMRPRFSV
jgi:uncharacterized membrane protein YhfC